MFHAGFYTRVMFYAGSKLILHVIFVLTAMSLKKVKLVLCYTMIIFHQLDFTFTDNPLKEISTVGSLYLELARDQEICSR